MENSKIKEETQKVTDVLSQFSAFVGGQLDAVVADSSDEDKAAIKEKVDKIKNGEFKEVQDKLQEVGVQLGKLK